MSDQSVTRNRLRDPMEALNYPEEGTYGLLAEFTTPDDLMRAANAAREAGFVNMDAYSPYPVEELDEALGMPKTRLPLAVLIAGLVGVCTAFVLMYVTSVYWYPLNIGGRPLNTWPMWVPIMFELTVLFASLTAVFGMIGRNGLPMPYHPVFNIDQFERASRDRFYLCIEAGDPAFDLEKTRVFLQDQKPTEIWEVPL